MPRPDKRRIEQLTAREVADRIGLLDGTQKGDRWRFAGYDGSHWIEFHADGAWTDHKHKNGGDAISLVQAFLAGAPDFAPGQHFIPALEKIAAAFDLWESIEPERQRARELGARREGRPPRDYLTAVVRDIEAGADAPLEPASSLFSALGVDPCRVTLCPDSEGTGSMCWQPHAPWQGVEVSRKEAGNFGGWTKERALAWSRDPDALRIVCLDFDGDGERSPSAELVLTMCERMRSAGLPPAVLVWSSVDDEGERAKAHLYFAAERAAPSEERWRNWWGLVAGAVAEIVADFDPEEAALLKPDPATRQVQRLVRLPGFAKRSKDVAGVVAHAWGARCDFDDWAETRDLKHTRKAGDKAITTVLGARCAVIEASAETGEVKEFYLGREMWPVARYETEPTPDAPSEHGVLVRFHTSSRRVVYHRISAKAFTDKRGMLAAAGSMRAEGAQIAMRMDHHLVGALGSMLMAEIPSRHVTLAQRPGWRGEAYIAGDRVIGKATADVLPDPTSGAFRRRARRAGFAEAWTRTVAARCTTPALRLAVGVSLAGASLGYAHQHPFVLHLAGASSTGKSLGVEVAASVWSSPDTKGGVATWDATLRALEALCEMSDGACLGLDEIGRWAGGVEQLAQAVHALGGGGGRARLEQHAGRYRLGAIREWACTTVSSGEVSIADLLGSRVQGGHQVRVLDLRLEPGDMTDSGAHTDALRAAAASCYGHAGPLFVEHLVSLEAGAFAARIDRARDALHEMAGAEHGETRRVLGIIALILATLAEAERAGVVPWDARARAELAAWVVERLIGGRAARREATPEHRMTRAFLSSVEGDEHRAPFLAGNTLSVTPRNLLAIREDPQGPGPGLIHTTIGYLRSSGLCSQVGVRPEEWLRWCKDQDWVVEQGQSRKAKRRERFWTLNHDRMSHDMGDSEGGPIGIVQPECHDE